jgi:hypothetical protein
MERNSFYSLKGKRKTTKHYNIIFTNENVYRHKAQEEIYIKMIKMSPVLSSDLEVIKIMWSNYNF